MAAPPQSPLRTVLAVVALLAVWSVPIAMTSCARHADAASSTSVGATDRGPGTDGTADDADGTDDADLADDPSAEPC